jgi:hypothetical protein
MKEAKILRWLIFFMYLALIATIADAQEPVITVDPAQDFQVMYDNDGNWTAITAMNVTLSDAPITESQKWLAFVGTRDFVADTSTVHPGAPTRLDFSIDLSSIPGTGWFTRVDVQCRVRATYETDAITGPWSEACKFWLFRAWSMAAAIHIP